jgi:hypothetical protein
MSTNFQQRFTDKFSQSCAARFSGVHAGVTTMNEVILQGTDLSGFAGPIPAFERNEPNHK